MNPLTGCILCGEELVYTNDLSEINCHYCGVAAQNELSCVNGHYVCPDCEKAAAEDLTMIFCLTTTSTDPIAIAMDLMNHPNFGVHGAEHHLLVPAALVAAFYNFKGQPGLKREALELARERSRVIPYGFCAMNGACGAGVGTGTFVSIITSASPLSGKEWQLSNMMTARSLDRIARAGGPRCCKRDTFIGFVTAIEFMDELLGVRLPVERRITCPYHAANRECTQEECMFYPEKTDKDRSRNTF